MPIHTPRPIPLPLLDRLRRLVPTREQVSENRWLRWLGPSLLHPRLWHVSRRGIALGTAVGVFFAFIIPVAQFPLSAATAVVLRANVPAALAGTLVNTPLTFGPVYYAAWRVGVLLLGEDAATAAPPRLPTGPQAEDIRDLPDPSGLLQRAWSNLRNVGKPLMLGAAVFAVGFGALAYALVNLGWHLRVRIKRRRRLQQRAAGSAPR